MARAPDLTQIGKQAHPVALIVCQMQGDVAAIVYVRAAHTA
jgi:hypothetical protein